jgi:prepilin-type processing-associated H-X9-DG protein
MSDFNAPANQPNSQKSSGLAIASLVLGILALVTTCILIGPLLGIVGLILGIIALNQIGKPGKPAGGKGMAVAGIVTSVMSFLLVLLMLMLAIMLPALSRAREMANRFACSANMRGITQTMFLYSNNNDDQFPPDLNLLVQDGSITAKSLQCLSADTANYIYVYPNKGANSPDDAILLYEPLHNHSNGEGMNIAFGDGHVEFVDAAEARALLEKQGLKVVE